jgi:hypothetical protein
MGKLIIYITETDQNWLKGLEYFVEEYGLEYKVIQYKSVEEVIKLSSLNSKEIYAIILDWELSPIGLIKQDAIYCLELNFPFVPIMAFSGKDFEGYTQTSNFKNKLSSDPEDLFNEINTNINFFKNEWLKTPVNNIFYTVQVFESRHDPIHNHKNILFYNQNPITSRKKAIDYFLKNDDTFQIKLHAANVVNSPELIKDENYIGQLNIYSSVLFDREIIANLNSEYQLYIRNKISIENENQLIQVPGSRFSFNVLRGIVDDTGNMILD